MSISPSSTILSRRNVLAAASAAFALTPFSTTPAGSPEVIPDFEAWLSKWRCFVDAEKKHSEACCRLDGAETAAKEEYPSARIRLPGIVVRFSHGNFVPHWSDTPPCNYVTLDKGRTTTRAEIEKHFEDRLKGKWIEKHSAQGRAVFLDEGKNRRDKILHECDVWKVVCMEVDRWHDVPALKDADLMRI